MVRRSLRGAVLLGIVLLPFLTACGGSGSSGAGDRPSISASLSPTRERPSATRTPGTPGDSSPAGPSSAPPSAPPTSRPPRTHGPASSSPAESSAAPSESNTAEGTSDSKDWWWLVILVVLVVGVLVSVLLVRRSRRRRAWEARLTAAEAEVGWFARDLIPQLRSSASPAGVSGGWAVASSRVTALDDQLTQLVSTAPGEGDRSRASALRGAVREARDRVVAVVSAGESSQWSLDLDDAQAPLLAVLVPPGPGTEQGPGSRPDQ
jgi:hypothetical protein